MAFVCVLASLRYAAVYRSSPSVQVLSVTALQLAMDLSGSLQLTTNFSGSLQLATDASVLVRLSMDRRGSFS